jgi:hypothetical protein
MDLTEFVVGAVFFFSASYAAIVLCLVAMNVALVVKLRSVIPQGE